MVISASRRTDLPCFYSDWFFRRLSEGYVCVRNPFNARQVSRISLDPQEVEGIVFWTKNPLPMLKRVSELPPVPSYFQFTLTGYGRDVEPGLPDKREVLIPAFQELSRRLGPGRVVWRYDPVFLSPDYPAEYHKKAFAEIAGRLAGYTDEVVISFLDLYVKIRKSVRDLNAAVGEEETLRELVRYFAGIAKQCGMTIVSCAEEMDLSGEGIAHGSCIDSIRLKRLGAARLNGKKDSGQRGACGCIKSVDIGTYHTCGNGCLYCYANFSPERVNRQREKYREGSPLLCDELWDQDTIRERK
jgi:hypothetical protein